MKTNKVYNPKRTAFVRDVTRYLLRKIDEQKDTLSKRELPLSDLAEILVWENYNARTKIDRKAETKENARRYLYRRLDVILEELREMSVQPERYPDPFYSLTMTPQRFFAELYEVTGTRILRQIIEQNFNGDYTVVVDTTVLKTVIAELKEIKKLGDY